MKESSKILIVIIVTAVVIGVGINCSPEESSCSKCIEEPAADKYSVLHKHYTDLPADPNGLWRTHYDVNDLEVIQTYNIALIRSALVNHLKEHQNVSKNKNAVSSATPGTTEAKAPAAGSVSAGQPRQ